MDIENLLRLLKEHNVNFVVIGAMAFPLHGYSRSTLDIDIFIEPEKDNAERCLAALAGFGYDTSDLTAQDLLDKKVLIRQYLIETDIHPFVKGVTFGEVWAGKVEGEIGSMKAWFAGLEQLIKMKQAAGRPKDLEDLKVLESLRSKKK